MISKDQKNRRRWLLACGLGIPIGFAIGQAISFGIGFATGNAKTWAMGLVIGPALTGMVLGIAQWLMLRDRSLPAYRWNVVTSISWAAGHAVTVLIGNAVYGAVNLALWQTSNLAVVWGVSGLVSGLVSGAIGGILVGLAQWWVLRKYSQISHHWILSTSLAWAIGHAVINVVNFTQLGIGGSVLSWVIYGLVYGMATYSPIARAYSKSDELDKILE